MNTTTSTPQRVGLILAAVLSLLNILSVASPTPEGETGPPMVVLVVSAVLGVVGLVGAVIGWRTGDRRALRVVTGALVVMALMATPAFFVDTTAGLKALVGLNVLVTILTCLLVLSPSRQPARAGYPS